MVTILPEWQYNQEPVAYQDALDAMESRVNGIVSGNEEELIWCLEHPSLYTAGTSANAKDLVDSDRFPVVHTGRGGQYTYHGPGVLMVYVMLDLRKRDMQDIKKYVCLLEEWVIGALSHLGIQGERRKDRVGIWVAKNEQVDEKIAAIGIRVRRWVTFHGFAINVSPDLSHFNGIVPCGVTQHGVTSLEALGHIVDLNKMQLLLKDHFLKTF